MQAMSYFCTVVRGAGRGEKLGFPTINLAPEKPLDFTGVFAGNLEISGVVHAGVIFVGKSATFSEKEKSVEIHLFDFNQIIDAGVEAELFVGEKIREIRKFSSEERLKEAILGDCAVAKEMGDLGKSLLLRASNVEYIKDPF